VAHTVLLGMGGEENVAHTASLGPWGGRGIPRTYRPCTMVAILPGHIQTSLGSWVHLASLMDVHAGQHSGVGPTAGRCTPVRLKKEKPPWVGASLTPQSPKGVMVGVSSARGCSARY